MMSNKFFTLAAALAVLCASTAVRAQSEIVIGDFEGPNNTNTDGWAGQNSTVISNFTGVAGTATRGTGALVVTPPGPGFTWAIRLDNNGRPTLASDLKTHPIVKADVSWLVNQWGGDATPNDLTDNWAKWDVVAVNDPTGWQQWGATGDSVNPSFPGSWDTNAGSRTQTVTWDLRSGPALEIDTTQWSQLWISVNMSNTSWTSGRPFWIDNIRLCVPEPATLSLVGLASLGLLALRRRSA